jgi:hypothetical protein
MYCADSDVPFNRRADPLDVTASSGYESSDADGRLWASASQEYPRIAQTDVIHLTQPFELDTRIKTLQDHSLGNEGQRPPSAIPAGPKG